MIILQVVVGILLALALLALGREWLDAVFWDETERAVALGLMIAAVIGIGFCLA